MRQAFGPESITDVGATFYGTAVRARRAQVLIQTEHHSYKGTLHVPEGKKRVSDVLCDGRPFVNLTDVSIDGADRLEPFLAVNKTVIHSLRIVGEAPAAVVPLRAR